MTYDDFDEENLDEELVCGGEDRANPDSWDDPEIDTRALPAPSYGEPYRPGAGPVRRALDRLRAVLPTRRGLLVNDLGSVLRAAGLKVEVDAGATRRNHGQLTAVRGIICHHTGSSGSGAWRVVRDGRAGLAGPLSQLTLERDGTVKVLSTGVAWHAGTGSWPGIGTNNGNAYCIGIEAVYNGSDITAEQRRVYPLLVAALAKHYRVAVANVIGHREWAPRRKIDPGQIDMHAFRRTVAEIVGGAKPAAGGGAGAVAPGEDRPLLVEGVTSALVWHLQGFTNRVFASYSRIDRGPGPTSRYGPQTIAVIKEFQRRVGFTGRDVDGKVGPMTWGQLEKHGFR